VTTLLEVLAERLNHAGSLRARARAGCDLRSACADGSGGWPFGRCLARRLSARYVLRFLDDCLDMKRISEAVQAQYRDVLLFVRGRMGSDDAEDVAQEVFADAAERLACSARTAPPTLGWLFTVAQRRMSDESRRRVRRRTVSLELVSDLESRPDPYGGVVATAFDSALEGLTDAQRRVVILRLLEGRSFAEIGTAVGATEVACRMRFMRALQHLRNEFQKEGLAP
jgi:RNA polymerase sigma factor (sigma-70 family)